MTTCPLSCKIYHRGQDASQLHNTTPLQTLHSRCAPLPLPRRSWALRSSSTLSKEYKTIIPRPWLLLPTNQMQKSHIEPLRNVSSLHPHEFHFSIPGVQNTVKELELHHRTHCIQILVLPTIIFTPHPCPTLPDISQATPCTSALPADGLPSLCTLHTAESHHRFFQIGCGLLC